MRKLIFPLLLGGLMGFYESAQAVDGDIINILSPYTAFNSPNPTIIRTSGGDIDIVFRLWGRFDLTNSVPGAYLTLPTIAMNVNGAPKAAYFSSINQKYDDDKSTFKTDITFLYHVCPGDMASPLTFTTYTGGYLFNFGGWSLVKSNTQLLFNQVISSDPTKLESGFQGGSTDYLTFAHQNIVISTLTLADNPTSVPERGTVTWALSTTDLAATNNVSLHLWTPTNFVQFGTVAGQTELARTIVTGAKSVTFDVTGVKAGSTYIYAIPESDYQTFSKPTTNFVSALTNYVRFPITVTPSPPAVSIKMTAVNKSSITVGEGATGVFSVNLSPAFTSSVPVSVLLTTSSSKITFDGVASTSKVVTVVSGATALEGITFKAMDGLSPDNTEIIHPQIISPVEASNYYTFVEGTVTITNAAPTLTAKLYNATSVTYGKAATYTWTASDVSADTNAMTVVWDFHDGPATNLTGITGFISHTFTTFGTNTVDVTATDKDGGSAYYTFPVVVNRPGPTPSVTVTTSAKTYGEATIGSTGYNTGLLTVSLYVPPAEVYASDVVLRLDVSSGQSNIALATNSVTVKMSNTNAIDVNFSVLDGTPASAMTAITITATVTNEASAYFTAPGVATINVTNIPPTITRPDSYDLANYTSIQQNRPFVFNYAVTDVNADTGATITVTWDFGDGTAKATVNGPEGFISHTFTSAGSKTVRITATDKDGGVANLIVPVTVAAMPAVPTVTVVPPSDALTELNGSGKVGIKLSETFTNLVTVSLAIYPATNAVSGAIKLSTNIVTFTANEVDSVLKVPYHEVSVTALDGTSVSLEPGFEIRPTVIATPASANYFTSMVSGYVKVYNVNPVIQLSPLPSDLTTGSVVVPQGTYFNFSWTVTDDSAVDLAAMRVVWSFGDGTYQTVYGAMGTVSNKYTSVGDMVVRATAYDKDGGSGYQTFKIQVQPSKEIQVTPIGPSTTSFYGVKGTGYGTISSPEARSPVAMYGSVYDFFYAPQQASATLIAKPYKFAGYDSFFFVWTGTDQGLSATKLDPYTAAQTWYTNSATPDSAVAVVSLSQSSSTNSVSREISAIFSREYLATDNMGDINQDGIPDMIAFQMEQSGNVDIGDLPPGTMNLKTLNTDLDKSGGTAVGDYLPINPSGAGGRFDFRPVADTKGGNDFDAFLEVRGYDENLNMVINGIRVSETNATIDVDEPHTDPLLADTDGDGFLDGWEYYFWYNSKFKGMTGSKYDPTNVSQGKLIPSKDIAYNFQPSVKATEGSNVRDTDGDGLLDIEEQAIGTNPVNWDTDGDGICDSWEILRGMDPCYPDDGLVATESNPDGDYMAYAQVGRQYVTLSDGGSNITCLVVTNITLRPGDKIGVAVTGTVYNANGNLTTWYTYGDSNALIAVGCPLTVASSATVLSNNVIQALVMHYQVLREFGFDPRTAWFHTVNISPNFDRFPAWINTVPNTKPFTSQDEYLLMKFMSENRMNGATGTMPSTGTTFKKFTTDPLTPDSDVTINNQDGMPDGWELYVSVNPAVDLSVPTNRVMTISPWNALDGDLDVEPATVINQIVPIAAKDGLINRREFGGTDSSACYTNAALYGSPSNFIGVVSITRPSVDANWINKFWPTNPWSHDTDGDGLNDLAERTFLYGTVTDNQTPCTQGGGLNPDSVDTDLDALPDAWEFEFTGTLPTAGTFGGSVTPVIVITNGMDGTVSDYDQDWDSDGLLNYQEYWTQAVRSFRYDITGVGTTNIFGKAGQPMDDTFAPSSLFTEVKNMWDQARYPWGDANPYLCVMLPLVNMYNKDNKPYLYASTDPRNFDTDGDGMDDYYEMYHGLNPLLGDTVNDDNVFVESADRVARACLVNGAPLIDYNINEWGKMLLLDFVKYPWMTGLPEADPDVDGLRNFEEQLQPNTPAPFYSHTDPTPMWMTDDSNTNSFTARFYHTMGYLDFTGKVYNASSSMFYWPPLPVVPPEAVYTFERNEGYDTDNDGISDKAELVNSKNKLSDPLDSDDPIRRQAIWFGGTNSAASVAKSFSLGTWSLRSFTVELWARPEEVNREQVLLERAFAYSPSDLSTTNKVVRRNFRIGIAADGRVFGSFDNAGAHDEYTATVKAYGSVLKTNEWVHIAARMDGSAGAFSLLVNGVVADTVPTTLVPANGVILVASTENNLGSDPYATIIKGGLIVGAANNHPGDLQKQVWADYSNFYKGFIDEVRIWDGARSDNEIWSNYKKRFDKSEWMNNRLQVQTQIASGYTRVWGNSLQLMPELLSDYNFDNLFGADVEAGVATSPRGFESGAVTNNQPADAVIRWWADTAVKSTVYTDYKYLPRIEDGISHMPIFGSATKVGGLVTVVMSNTVADSVYWTHTAAGKISGVFNFPNSANPYNTTSDLIPLGSAFAKQVTDLWDGNGASGVWLETVTDSDFDGLPDWWEEYITSGGNTTSVDWNAVNAFGKTNGEQYQHDIANGMTALNNPFKNAPGWKAADSNGNRAAEDSNPVVKQTSDLDGDGMPDWWENIYSLNPASAEGDDGALGDPDKDGLSNLAEYMISEVYKLRYLSPIKIKTNATQKFTDYFQPQGKLTLGAMFTDHDFTEDTWEAQFASTYSSPYLYDPLNDADEDGWSNWAECRYSAAHDNSLVRPDRTMATDPNGNMIFSFPVPILQTTLRYKGDQTGNIIIQVYSDPAMNGIANATYNMPTDVSTVTAKTQPLGYWSDKTVSDTLSPGAVKPGTVGLKFTDLWTGLSLTTGFDADGILYYGTVGGVSGPIGTIDYTTGKFTLDLDHYKNGHVVPSDNAAAATNRADYVDCNVSYIDMSYSVHAISSWPKTAYLGRADSGYVREGTNYVFAFIDVDSSGTWDPGEPCGVATPFATDIGWDYNWLNIQLTDYTPGYLRLSLATGQRSDDVISGSAAASSASSSSSSSALETRIRVRRTLSDGNTTYARTILEKVLKNRTYLHEGDFLAQGDLAMDWGFVGVATNTSRTAFSYEVAVADATLATNNLTWTTVATFSNRVDSVRGQAVVTSPISGASVYSARPVFRWKMPADYTAFAIEIKRGSLSGPTVYQSGAVQAPIKDMVTGEYVWTAPISAGSILANGEIFATDTLYVWRVIPLNARFTLTPALGISALPVTWTAWTYFRLSTGTSSGYGELRASVKYFGPATSNILNRVKVQVFRTAGFTGEPDAQHTLTSTEMVLLTNGVASATNVVLRGLAPSASVGNYYVRAYIDYNMNGVKDAWESWGYANYYGLTSTPYTPRPFAVTVSPTADFATIIIEDADTDNDWFPDAWEYEQNPNGDFLNLTTPSATWDGTSNIQLEKVLGGASTSSPILMTLALGTSDATGVGDLAGLILGTSGATANDGYTATDKFSLGLAASDFLALQVTAINATETTPNLSWSLGVTKDPSADRTTLNTIIGVSGTATYIIEYTPSLLNADWREVESGPVLLDGVQGGTSVIDTSRIDLTKGFFRIRLSN